MELLGAHALGMQVERVVLPEAVCLWIALGLAHDLSCHEVRMHFNICRFVANSKHNLGVGCAQQHECEPSRIASGLCAVSLEGATPRSTMESKIDAMVSRSMITCCGII